MSPGFLRTITLSLLILVSGGGLAACGGGDDTQLEPISLAFIVPRNYTITGSQTVGETSGFVEFDVVRERDNEVLTNPINVLMIPEETSSLTDELGNTVFPQRSVVLLGNGPDPDEDGVPDLPPDRVPDTLDPLAPYTPPEEWQARSALAYVPGQTNIPNRSSLNRFGIAFSAMLPTNVTLQGLIRDELNQVLSTTLEFSLDPAPTQTVSVFLGNAEASQDQPVVIAVCNQLNAAAYVGLKGGLSTTLAVPALQSTPDTSLTDPTAYRAEAYQFDRGGTVLRVSSNPTSPDQLSVPLLSASMPEGTATLTLVDISDGGVNSFSCARDRLSDLQNLLPEFFE